MKNKVKTVLFAGLIAEMLLPFSEMDLPEAFAMQHDRKAGMHFHHKMMNIVTEKITNDFPQMLRDSKATSFNEIPHIDRPDTDDTDDISHVSYRR